MKKYKIIDVSLCLVIVLMNLLVGTPIKYNIDFVNIIINIIGLSYIGWTSIKSEKKIELDKFDICVLILVLSTFIPVISNKYLRLRDTIYCITKYVSMFNIYFIIKKYVKLDKSHIKIITNTTIIMSVLLIIFGIDLLTINIFDKLYQIFKIAKLYNESTYSMSSLFKYSNAFAIFIEFVLFLTLGSYLNENKNIKLKKAYGMCIFFQIFAILASYSRLALLFLIIFNVIFILIAKKKRFEITKITLISGILAIFYFMLFTKYRISGNIFGIWISLILVTISCYFLLYKINININMKKNTKRFKQNIKYILPIVIFVFACLIIYIMLPKKLVLFNNINAKQSFRKQNIKVEPNTEYNIQVNLNAISKEKENFAIYVKELNNEEKKVTEKEIKFDNYNGIKQINITTNLETKTISIIFKCFNLSSDTKLEIKNVYINDEKVNVNYGLIPLEFVNKIQKISMNSISVKARVAYIKEAFKIAKENILLGYGGNAWRFVEKDLTIEDSIVEHSFIMELLIQFGIVGCLSYITLIIILAVNSYRYLKNNRDNFLNISIILAIFIIVIHSVIDFEISFFNVFITVFIYIAILSTIFESKVKRISYKWRYLYITILIVFLYINVGGLISYYINTDKIKDNDEKLKLTNIKIALAPYDYSYRIDKVNCLLTKKNTNVSEIGTKEYIDACNEVIKQQNYIINIEKKKEEYEYRTLVYNKLDIINEENQKEILNEITNILNDKNIDNNSVIINGIKAKLLKRLNNETSKHYIENLNTLLREE